MAFLPGVIRTLIFGLIWTPAGSIFEVQSDELIFSKDNSAAFSLLNGVPLDPLG